MFNRINNFKGFKYPEKVENPFQLGQEYKKELDASGTGILNMSCNEQPPVSIAENFLEVDPPEKYYSDRFMEEPLEIKPRECNSELVLNEIDEVNPEFINKLGSDQVLYTFNNSYDDYYGNYDLEVIHEGTFIDNHISLHSSELRSKLRLGPSNYKTWSCWVRPTIDSTRRSLMYTIGADDRGNNYEVEFKQDRNNSSNCKISLNGGYNDGSFYDYKDSKEWEFISFSYTDDNNLELYHNGEFYSTTNSTNGKDAVGDLVIGKGGIGAWKGTNCICDIRNMRCIKEYIDSEKMKELYEFEVQQNEEGAGAI